MNESYTAVRQEAPAAVHRIALVAPDEKRGRELAHAVRAGSPAWHVTVVAGGLSQAVGALGRSDPDALVLDATGEAAPVLAQIERMMKLYPAMQVLVLSDDHSAEALKAAMRVGVRDVLPREVDGPALAGAVRRVLERRTSDAPREGRVLAFMPCKGGGGCTFVAANTAFALAESGQRVILIDLDLQWGDAELFVTDARATVNLASLVAQIERVDALFLASSLVQAHPNLGVLAAPDDPAAALGVRPEHIDVVLRLARAHYDFVIVDAGPSLDAVTVRALDYAEAVFPVLQMNLPVVRDAGRLMKAFRSLGYAPEKIRPVVNRYEKGGPVQREDLERTMGVPVFRTLPNDYAAASDSVNQGVPVLRLHRHAAIARAIAEFAAALAPVGAGRKDGWLSRMLGRA